MPIELYNLSENASFIDGDLDMILDAINDIKEIGDKEDKVIKTIATFLESTNKLMLIQLKRGLFICIVKKASNQYTLGIGTDIEFITKFMIL